MSECKCGTGQPAGVFAEILAEQGYVSEVDPGEAPAARSEPKNPTTREAAAPPYELTKRRIAALGILLLHADGQRRRQFYQSVGLRDFLENANVVKELTAAEQTLNDIA